MASIMIAENSVTQAAHLRALLEQANHSVIVATNGKQVVQVLDETLPDIIIADLNIPKMDGLELVEYTKKHHPDIPVVVMTASGSENTAVAAMRQGAASCLPKRFLTQSLVRTISEILGHIKAQHCQKEVLEALVATESTYIIGNDHQFAGRVIAQMEEQLRSMNYHDKTMVQRITTALQEAVANAIDHGNLELNSDLRDQDGPGYSDLRQQRAQQHPWKTRQITITSRVTAEQARYTIADQGRGFDPLSLPDPLDPENLLRTHGRGLLLIRNFMDEVTHNKVGNVITMVKHRKLSENAATANPRFSN